MACFSPLIAFRNEGGPSKKTGLTPITFDASQGDIQNPLKIPCGKCIGCRLDKSIHWAMRCVCEAKMHEKNCFITLTYNDDYLKTQCKNGSLNKRDFVLFLKSLRKDVWNDYKRRIRYYHCGEYGDRFNRPHHHAAIFNHDFPDKILLKRENDVRIYTSRALEERWGMGYCTVGEITTASAAYIARYCTKKINGKLQKYHYEGRTPEYATMSRKPGIGKSYWDIYRESIGSIDGVMVNPGKIVKPGRYFDSLESKLNPVKMEQIKKARLAKVNEDDNTYARLKVKEILKQNQYKQLERHFENGQ